MTDISKYIHNKSPTWIKTVDILTNPELYYGSNIIFGSKYSLLSFDKFTRHDNNNLNYFLFRKSEVEIIKSIHLDTSLYVLVYVPSIHIYDLFESRFRVETINAPEVYDIKDFSPQTSDFFEYYEITCIFPNGEFKHFNYKVK